MGLSLGLPLQGEAFEDQQCQISRQNDFGLLELIGGDCAGAVSLRPAGSGPENGDGSRVQSGVEWLDCQQLALLLDELPRRPMLAGRDGMRLSLGVPFQPVPLGGHGGGKLCWQLFGVLYRLYGMANRGNQHRVALWIHRGCPAGTRAVTAKQAKPLQRRCLAPAKCWGKRAAINGEA